MKNQQVFKGVTLCYTMNKRGVSFIAHNFSLFSNTQNLKGLMSL